jgi:hypothetical protein
MNNNETYKNLTQSELNRADHYAETGNNTGLRELRELSRRRGNTEPARWHHSNTNRN